jgi:hypothetical protein
MKALVDGLEPLERFSYDMAGVENERQDFALVADRCDPSSW